MTWTTFYPALLVLHVLSVFAFLALHGVSMGVWWKVRRERDRARLGPLFELSAGFVTPMLLAGLLLIVSGILVGVAAGWWFNGQWWLWLSIGLLFAIVMLMNPLVAIPMNEMRQGLGLKPTVEPKAGKVVTPVDDGDLDRLLLDRRPLIGGSVAIVGIVLITWLMESKPF
jgi:hypothetical protein